jgi:fumarate reductase flavoprotein subunit
MLAEHLRLDAQVDVLVVGAGGCGLVAALAAHDANPQLDIAVVEKLDRLRGNSMLSSGSIAAAGTRLQQEAGVHDSVQALIADLDRVAGEHEAPELKHRLAEVSGELVDWLVDRIGVHLTLVTTYKHVGHSVHRLHSPPSRRGADLMNELFVKTEQRGIPVAFGNPVVELIVDQTSSVRGVMTRTDSGDVTAIGARAVILATNGFGANQKLIARYCPELSGKPYGGAIGSEGEAIEWGLSLGADLRNMQGYQAHASLANPHGSLVTWTIVEKGGFVIDAQGNRFGNESLGYSAFAALELARTGPFFVIADTRVRDLTAAGQEEYADLVRHGGVIEAPTIAELASRLGIEANTLTRTIEDASRAAQGSVADPFERTDWGLGPLQAPFTATRIGPALFHTQGGLRVDINGRVLRKDGAAITGLYAGGGAAAGISGNRGSAGYISGNGLLSALGLGYLSGRAAAHDIRP